MNENLQVQTLEIGVWLSYQGRSALRYRYNFSYDPEEIDRIMFDDPQAKDGLTQAVSMISQALTHTIKLNLGMQPLDLNAFRKLDGVMLSFYEQNLAQPEEPKEESKTAMSQNRPTTSNSGKSAQTIDSPGKAFIKACSEALFMGVANCIKQEVSLAQSIRQNMHPV